MIELVTITLAVNKTSAWHRDRFIEDADKVKKSCVFCGTNYWLPPSKAGLYRSCSNECGQAYRAQIKLDRKRACQECGREFVPRAQQVKDGQGIYCSSACSAKNSTLCRSPETYKKITASRNKSLAEGLWAPKKGRENPSWKGGPAFHAKKILLPGEAAENLRRYRAENPNKVKEFSQTRRGKKTGKLPRGTIQKIGEMQGWLCRICGVDLHTAGSHTDHIKAISKGGLHVPENIQLLCPTCNVRKSAKDLDQFLKEIGRYEEYYARV